MRQFNQQASTLNFRERVLAVIAELIKDYYDLMLAFQDFKVNQSAVSLRAEEAVDRRDQLERGLGSARELQLAETEIAISYERFLLARQTMLQKSADISRRLDVDEKGGWGKVYLPAHALIGPPAGIERDAAVQRAPANSPGYLSAQTKIESLATEVGYHRNQTLPSLDLSMEYAYRGLDGSVRSSMRNALGGDTPEMALGLKFSMPIGNREAQGRLSEARIRHQQAVLEAHVERQKLTSSIDKMLTAVNSSRERIGAVHNTVTMAERNLSSESERLEKGLTDELSVKRFRHHVREAELRELAALVDLQKALTNLWASDGSLLERHEIELAGANAQELQSEEGLPQ